MLGFGHATPASWALRAAATLLAFWVYAAHGAMAADISLAGKIVFLSGRIEKGDLERLTRQVADAQLAGATGLTVSLNSEGGSFDESLRIANFLNSSALPTRVSRGNRCLSACAFVFLAGASRKGDEAQSEISRTLEPGAELGFHLPYAAPGDGATEDQLRLAETEAIYQLSKVFAQYDVPKDLWTLLLKNDAAHSFYDATSVEAIVLLGITVEDSFDTPPPLTRQMAENVCINSFYLSQRKLPSAQRERAVAEIGELIRAQPIARPRGEASDFLLLPLTRTQSPNGIVEVVTCRVSNDAACQGMFWPDAVKVNTEGETPIDSLPGCQIDTELALSVPPTTRLAEVKTTLAQMARSQTALLRAPGAQSAAGDADIEHDAGPDAAEPEQAAPPPQPQQAPVVVARPGVVCNANQSFANVRAGPNSSQFQIVATLPNQTAVTIVGETRNPVSNHPWYEIAFASGRGFIDSELVQNSCLVAMPLPTPPAPPPPPGREAVVCNAKGDSANLRDYPHPKSSVVKRKLFNHEALTIIGEANNPDSGQLYFKVRAQGIEGYIDNELVSVTCNLPRPGETVVPEPVVSTDNGTAAVICNVRYPVTNMRSGPNPDTFGIKLTLSNNTPVQVLARTTNPASGAPWLEVMAGGERGFIDASNVAPSCDNVVPVIAVKQICNRKTGLTNMRNGPNKNFDLVTTLSNSTQVEILEQVSNPETGHPWIRIRADGLEGYIDSELVSDQC